MNFMLRAHFIDRTKGINYGDTGWHDTAYESRGELYRKMVREYGRCISKMYLDTKGQEAKEIGWVFVKRAQYEDSKKTYLQETWVEVRQYE